MLVFTTVPTPTIIEDTTWWELTTCSAGGVGRYERPHVVLFSHEHTTPDPNADVDKHLLSEHAQALLASEVHVRRQRGHMDRQRGLIVHCLWRRRCRHTMFSRPQTMRRHVQRPLLMDYSTLHSFRVAVVVTCFGPPTLSTDSINGARVVGQGLRQGHG